MSFSIQHNSQEVIRRFTRLSQRIMKLRPVLRATAKHLVRNYKRVHVDQAYRAERGLSWPPRKRFYPWPLLKKSGALAGSYSFEILNDMQAKVVSTGVPYAIFHHRGVPSINLPRRRTLTVTDQDRKFLKKKLREHLQIGIRS